MPKKNRGILISHDSDADYGNKKGGSPKGIPPEILSYLAGIPISYPTTNCWNWIYWQFLSSAFS